MTALHPGGAAGAPPRLDSIAGDDDFGVLRRSEFGRLQATGEVYLDYTGSALYLASHLEWHVRLLAEGVFGNPHAEGPASRASTDWSEAARQSVLDFLDADPAEYEVIFTLNASAAAKLVAESFPFSRRSRLVLSADNHNSILGVREYARRRGARTTYIPLDDDLRLRDVARSLSAEAGSGPNLLAFPAQSNFSGVRHPLALVRLAQGMGFSVLLDAAAYVPSAVLSLRTVPADFATLSLYKVIGYPTGVGALVARRTALSQLQRPWFAGGTVEFSSVQGEAYRLRAGAEGYQDGTINFLALSAVPEGLRRFRALGIDRIGAHVRGLTSLLLEGLVALRHGNGRPLVTLLGPVNGTARGGTVTFNIFDRHGRWIPHWEVERSLASQRISVRAGCFCNPGAAERALGFDARRAAACREAGGRGPGAVPFSIERFARCMGGTAVGAVRASVGPANSEDDVERLLRALDRWSDVGPRAARGVGRSDERCG
ncbi:MAG: aminotransferase class V-fold PLP-dependent enzyme [Gemmatimonadaceae bacterium]